MFEHAFEALIIWYIPDYNQLNYQAILHWELLKIDCLKIIFMMTWFRMYAT